MKAKTILAALAALLLSGPAFAEDVVSPPYTVLVMMEYQSPFVDDGRSSFADFAFSVTFEDVRFHFDNSQPLPMLAFGIDNPQGKGTLSRHALNRVETGGKVVAPKVTRGPGKEFEAWLRIPQGPWRREWGEADPANQSPMPLQFITAWGPDMMRWDYEVADEALAEVGIEAFVVNWERISAGLPVSVALPYQGTYEEDKGNWLIDFIPQKKK